MIDTKGTKSAKKGKDFWFFTHLIVPLNKVGCISTIKINVILFCIVFNLHYLCNAFNIELWEIAANIST